MRFLKKKFPKKITYFSLWRKNRNIKKATRSELRGFQPSVLFNSTWLYHFFNMLAKHGTHQKVRYQLAQFFVLLRLKYTLLGATFFFKSLKFYYFPLITKKIIRRRGTYEKLRATRPNRQRKVALKLYTDLINSGGTKEKTFCATLVKTTCDTVFSKPDYIYKPYEHLWAVAWERPSIRRRQRFKF